MRPLLLLGTLLSLGHLGLAVQLVRAVRANVRVPLAPAPEPPPLVSVIVPARNEEGNIAACVRSLLAQEYPNLEVIVLDDRSTDRTGAILAGLVATDPRLTVLAGAPLPEGWVGKCWAVHQAAQRARGDWLLFTDADTVHGPATVGSVVRFAQERGADLLSLGTGQRLETFWEKALLPWILALIVLGGGSVAEVNDPRSPVAKANGQFLLFRAAAYRALGGHAAVRDQLVEDFELARLVKRSGYRLLLADGRHLVTTRMYRGLREIWEGFSKNSWREASRTPGSLFNTLVLLPLGTLGPPLLLARGLLRRRRGRRDRVEAALLVQSGAQTLWLGGFGALAARALGASAGYGLCFPLAALFLQGVVLHSAYRTLSGKGVRWKGRTY